MLERNSLGRFELKGDEYRKVRSFRLTDKDWEKMGELSESLGLTKSDFLELIIREKSKEELPIINAIDDSIESKIRDLIEGLKKGGENQLQIVSKEKAIVRRAFEALLEYLK